MYIQMPYPVFNIVVSCKTSKKQFRIIKFYEREQMDLTTDTGIFANEQWEILIRELRLSPRQSQVIQLLFSGLSDKQIAMHLEIAVPTVRTHLTRLFSRFSLQDSNELIVHVFRQFRNGCPINGNGCPRWISSCGTSQHAKSDVMVHQLTI